MAKLLDKRSQYIWWTVLSLLLLEIVLIKNFYFMRTKTFMEFVSTLNILLAFILLQWSYNLLKVLIFHPTISIRETVLDYRFVFHEQNVQFCRLNIIILCGYQWSLWVTYFVIILTTILCLWLTRVLPTTTTTTGPNQGWKWKGGEGEGEGEEKI